LLPTVPVHAAVGINQQLNFQGRLLSNAGAVVADGNYNMRFKIYQDGPGNVAGDTGGSLMWTEKWENQLSNPIVVKNGYFSVALGSTCAFTGGSCQSNTNTAIDWNQSVLWLSMDVGGTATGAVTYTGELVPMRQMASSVYAMNAGQLGGLSSAQFVQLAQGVQTDSSTTNASIFLNKTGTTANILDLQRGGADVAVINNAGQTVFRPQTDAVTALQVQKAGTTTAVLDVDTSNSRVGINTAAPDADLSFGAGANRTIDVVAQTASNTAGDNLSVAAAAGNGTGAGGTLALAGGAGGATNANGGNVTISGGAKTGTGTGGSVIIKPQASNDSLTAFQIQNAAGTPMLTANTTNSRLQVANTTSLELGAAELDSPYGGIGQISNLLTFTQAFDNANWTKTNVTVTADDGSSNPAPDSTTTADKLVSTSATATVAETSATAPTNASYTFSWCWDQPPVYTTPWEVTPKVSLFRAFMPTGRYMLAAPIAG
jgi:hypothetical protein